MKEITEIKLSDDLLKRKDELLQNRFIIFRQTSTDSSSIKAIGVYISLQKNILRLSTQMYNERIPLCDMNKGTQVDFLNSFQNEDKLGQGMITAKYFIKATKEDWKIENEIGHTNSYEISIDISINEIEKEALELGGIPLSMDDKWFSYCHDNEFHFYRSLTGTEEFKGKIIKSNSKKGQWFITKIIIPKESCINEENKKDRIEQLLKYTIKNNFKLLSN